MLPPSGVIQDEGGQTAVAAAVEHVAAHFKGQEFRKSSCQSPVAGEGVPGCTADRARFLAAPESFSTV